MFGIVVIHLIDVFYKPPARYPDLVTMMFTVYSFIHFFVAFLYVYMIQFGFVKPRELGEKEKNKND